ncbi:MAG: hypothetical protein Q7W30_02590 [Coriobacteriia bacterium]|nr:hypothetical protein [Coriobacteriia bacterium]
MDIRKLRTRLGGAAHDDRGVALMVVLAAMTMLFLLATMLIATSVYQIKSTERQEVRSKAVQIADAGLSAYLYELRRQQTFYKTDPTLGPVTTADGRWIVTATAPTETPAGQPIPLTLRATGYATARNETRTIVAQVRFPTFADYATLSDAAINWGANRTINGKVHSNDSVTQNYASTYITGKVTAVHAVSGYTDTAHMTQGYKSNNDALYIDFNKVVTDINRLVTMATNNGNYYGPSGAKGYRVVFNGDKYNIDRIDSITTAGTMTVTAVRANQPIPPDSVIYVKDDCWIWGTYSAPITFGCGDPAKSQDYDVTIPKDFVAVTRAGQYKAGVVAVSDIYIPYWYQKPSYPDSFTVQAALLAQSGYVGAFSDGNSAPAGTATNFNMIGSTSYKASGFFTVTDTNGNTTKGFKARGIYFDRGLEFYPPPEYPVLNMGNLKINSWTEQ